MQKTFIAIALALTLSCAFAAYTPTGYAKDPIEVVKDGETNFTAAGNNIDLHSLQIGELDLTSGKSVINATSVSYVAFWRKLEAKALTGTANNTLTVVLAPARYLNGFAINIVASADSANVSQLRAIQYPIGGGNAIPVVNFTNNTNVNFTPSAVATVVIGKTVYVFVKQNDKAVNISNFVAGGVKGSVETIFHTAYDTVSELQTVWGEALGNNQIYANWKEGTPAVLKSATIDVSKATAVTSANVEKWALGFSCKAYATDKKLSGTFCSNTSNGTNTYFASTNSTTLNPVANSSDSLTIHSVYPYGPYLGVVYSDVKTTVGSTIYAVEVLDLEKAASTKNRTNFLTIDGNSTVEFFRVTSAGLYTLLYNNAPTGQNVTGGYTGVKVGLLLGGSYLTTVFGFLLTIVAGLFLF